MTAKETWKMIGEELSVCCNTRVWYQRLLTVFFSVPFQTIALFRLIQFLRQKRLRPLDRILLHYQRVLSGCYIHPSAKIGRGCRFPHPVGIVIGQDVRIGNNVTIYQNVTLGSHGDPEEQRRYPTVEDGARLYAGAIIIGSVRVGQRAIVGAGAVVLEDVPPNSVVVGVPARIVNHHPSLSDMPHETSVVEERPLNHQGLC